MKPRIRIGLTVGAIGLALNVCVATLVGFCGPFVSLIAGAIAGYLAVQQEKPTVKGEGAKIGATAGAIAGGLVIIGQVIGGVGALMFLQSSGGQFSFGAVPQTSSDPSLQVVYYLTGMGTAFCFGLVGALLAAGAGAGAGYIATPDQPSAPLNPPMG